MRRTRTSRVRDLAQGPARGILPQRGHRHRPRRSTARCAACVARSCVPVRHRRVPSHRPRGVTVDHETDVAAPKAPADPRSTSGSPPSSEVHRFPRPMAKTPAPPYPTGRRAERPARTSTPSRRPSPLREAGAPAGPRVRGGRTNRRLERYASASTRWTRPRRRWQAARGGGTGRRHRRAPGRTQERRRCTGPMARRPTPRRRDRRCPVRPRAALNPQSRRPPLGTTIHPRALRSTSAGSAPPAPPPRRQRPRWGGESRRAGAGRHRRGRPGAEPQTAESQRDDAAPDAPGPGSRSSRGRGSRGAGRLQGWESGRTTPRPRRARHSARSR